MTPISTLTELRELHPDLQDYLLDLLLNGVSIKTALRRMRDDKQIDIGKKVDVRRFLQQASKDRWKHRFASAAIEADAIMANFPDVMEKMDQAIVAAIKQETFRLLIQQKLDAGRVKQFFELFLKEKTSALAQAKHEADRQAKFEAALDAFAEHLEDETHATARQHYAALRAAVLEQSPTAEPVAATTSQAKNQPLTDPVSTGSNVTLEEAA